MGRTVSYSVVKRNNPLDQDAVPKFYAQAADITNEQRIANLEIAVQEILLLLKGRHTNE
jgi:hypothetical protein